MDVKAGQEVKATMAHALGEMTWLLSQSPIYKHLKIADLEWMVMPPMLLGQYRIFKSEGKPVGFALWAFLSESVEKRFTDNVKAGEKAKLEAQEWNSGNRPWLIELVCPFASQENKLQEILMKELTEQVFGGKRFSWVELWNSPLANKTQVS